MEAFGTSGWEWLNPPNTWTAHEDLRITTDPKTDFWRTTHYGYDRANGHLLGRRRDGDLRIAATFSGDYAEQYDQAGVALWADDRTWIKAGIELVDGTYALSVVVTRDASDWSVLPLDGAPGETRLDLKREGDAVSVAFGAGETLVRLAYFPPDKPVLAGAMAASPEGEGFNVRFARLDVASA